MKTAFHPPFGVDHAEHQDGAWMCSPDGAEEPQDLSRHNVPMIAVLVVLLPPLFAGVVLLVRYFIKG